MSGCCTPHRPLAGRPVADPGRVTRRTVRDVTERQTAAVRTGPATLRWAVWLLSAQAVAMAGVTGFFAYEDLTAAPERVRDALAITVYFAVLAVLLGLLAWSLVRRRSWARSPAIVLELMLVPVGYYMIEGGHPVYGVPVMLLGLACAGLLLAPQTREALGIR